MRTFDSKIVVSFNQTRNLINEISFVTNKYNSKGITISEMWLKCSEIDALIWNGNDVDLA